MIKEPFIGQKIIGLMQKNGKTQFYNGTIFRVEKRRDSSYNIYYNIRVDSSDQFLCFSDNVYEDTKQNRVILAKQLIDLVKNEILK